MVLLHEGLVRGLDIVLLDRRGIGGMNKGCAFGLDFGLVFRAIAGKRKDGDLRFDVSMRTVQSRGSLGVEVRASRSWRGDARRRVSSASQND